MSDAVFSRRNVLRLAGAVGGATTLSTFLAACGRSAPSAGAVTSSGSVTAAGSVTPAGLKGESLALTILGVAGWPPSQMAGKFANGKFKDYAKSDLGYDVTFGVPEAPFDQLFQKAATTLATKSEEFNIMISDSQWMGAFAQAKWITPLNDIIKANKNLQIDWYSKVVTDGYMNYPAGTDTIYGLPQEGDVQVMFLRKDMLEDPKEQAAFKAKYKKDLPQTWDEYEKLTWEDYTPIMEFFTRPDKGLYGMALQYSKVYDTISCFYTPFVFSRGGNIWDSKTNNVQGILNTDANAAALREFIALKKYCPPGADQVGIAETADLFTQGKVFSCVQWAAMGPAMIPDKLKGKVIVVPPPGFKEGRTYQLGGQPWVVNAFNDEKKMQASVDFLSWWYLPATQLDFAKAGGNPCDKATLESPGFDDLQPWFKSYKYMLKDGKSNDFWHVPVYAKMLADQQEGLTAFSTGQVKDARLALDWIAYKHQEALHGAGLTNTAPTGDLPALG